MKNSKPPNPGQWTPKGLVSRWYTYRLQNFKWRRKLEILLTTESWADPDYPEPCNALFRAYVSSKESPETLQYFQDAITAGTSYVLTAKPLESPLRVGLVVNKVPGDFGDMDKRWSVAFLLGKRTVGFFFMRILQPEVIPQDKYRPESNPDYGQVQGNRPPQDVLHPNLYKFSPFPMLLPPESFELKQEDPREVLCSVDFDSEWLTTQPERPALDGAESFILPPARHTPTAIQQVHGSPELYEGELYVDEEAYPELAALEQAY
ncbi:hypothetical protein QBC36DRAFT_313448 [Triangularia setosa]|uniref:Uncharacterized protein n=1 Tax=Triangularia setosa TaxID=2587417 RepID=A0AAN6W2U5_9PEZI|nr:hypothetical protein QBC36DRAFT_313448 [Podospora setosa]